VYVFNRYVHKTDEELAKNHQANQKSLVTGHMPEDRISTDLCPVRLFEKYLTKLNPKCDRSEHELIGHDSYHNKRNFYHNI